MTRTASTLLLLLTMLVPLVSCSSEVIADFEEEVDKGKTSKNIKFSISPYETGKFRSAAADAFSQLSFVLFPIDGEASQIEVTQAEGDENFGTVSADIPFGNYELVIVGHNCADAATVVSPDSIAFPQGKITDTFCHYQTLEVSKETTRALNIELKRCVAKFEVFATDAIPEWIAQMHVVAEGGGVVLNAKTGLAAKDAVQDKRLDIPASFIGKTGKYFSTYTFLPTEEANMSFTLSAIDAEGNTRLAHEFTDAPMTVNQITRYTGELFCTSVHTGGNITADTEWTATNEFTF